MEIVVICCKCDRTFRFKLTMVLARQAFFMDENGDKLGSRLIRPKAYIVPCPYCGAENEVPCP